MPLNPFRPECLPTAVGSLPHKDPAVAVDAVLQRLPEIPFWPQLPSRGFLENMCPMYSEGLPGARVDETERRIWVDTSDLLGEMERLYERYLSEDLNYFHISSDYAAGLHEFIRRLNRLPSKPKLVKGHITGPITWGLTVTDANKRAAFYDEQLKDGIVKALARKAAWQVSELKEAGVPIILFIDEPYLQSVGSSFVSLQREEVIEKLNEVIAAAHEHGAYAGVHCCGNSDWGLIASSDVDILNFDAYGYGDTISLYPREVGALLERGGVIAWGIVPASAEVMNETAEGLVARFREVVKRLAEKTISEDRILAASLITPSCGGGSLSVAEAERMLELAHGVSDILRG